MASAEVPVVPAGFSDKGLDAGAVFIERDKNKVIRNTRTIRFKGTLL
jgi:hypothetical protein